MQFIKGGPDIPERLLQRHEDGNVVFFCGAGISYPAGLPGFIDLTKELYGNLSVVPNAVQRSAIKGKLSDRAIELLEASFIDGRYRTRQELAKILTPKSITLKSIATHKSLLTLSENRETEYTRLITTNFDRLFEDAINYNLQSPNHYKEPDRYQAPLLPIPSKSWNGLIYLHGLLFRKPSEDDLDKLVLASSDFGRAYLTERWASRFVSEVFRRHTVCFVGYSINDPVLRYMMDALAAERRQGESYPEAFAFGNYAKGREEDQRDEWKAKGVTPILYRNHYRHYYLHRTLQEWADAYRDGIRGKEYIVAQSVLAQPLPSTQQDHFVDRLLWALSDSSGLPARHFAEMNPTPSLEWLLGPLSENRYEYDDLARFGVSPNIPPNDAFDKDIAFSMVDRPTPYHLAQFMAFVSRGFGGYSWDKVMLYLSEWLLRHLGDPELLLWLVERGDHLHRQFADPIGRQLDKIAELERDGETDELYLLCVGAPKAIPTPSMRTLWRLFLAKRFKYNMRYLGIEDCVYRFKREGLTFSLRLALREALMPRITLRRSPHISFYSKQPPEGDDIRGYIEWSLVLTSSFVHSSLDSLYEDERWISALPELLSDFTSLLRDAYNLMHELRDIEILSDRSYIHQPSISEHSQNSDGQDWTALISLTRDAWLAALEQHLLEQARTEISIWRQVPYPLFRRLVFFAATKNEIVPARTALEWLLEDNNRWLWSIETERETIRLIVSLALILDRDDLAKLEHAIFDGPPRTMYRSDFDPEEWTRVRDRKIWLRLAKINQTGANLSEIARGRLTSLRDRYPQWHLADDERDEFPFWVGEVWVGDRDPWRTFLPVPRSEHGMLDYLLSHPELKEWEWDDWSDRCEIDFQTTSYALCQLARQNEIWPAFRWRDALYAWSQESLQSISWRDIAPVLIDIPNEELLLIAHDIGRWLRAVAKTHEGHEELFFILARRILALNHLYELENFYDNPVIEAINHPVGYVTEALLFLWQRQTLEDGQGLPNDIRPIFTEICNTQVKNYRHGRVLLAANILTLFRVDPTWTTQYLLPLFDWQNPEAEARGAWFGYLWSPRIHRHLMEKLKPMFLDAANHYSELSHDNGGCNEQYISLLVFSALDLGDMFTNTELSDAVRKLPQDGLHNVAKALVRALKGAGDRHVDHWKNRVAPFLKSVWPWERENFSPYVTRYFSLLCIEAGSAFPDAFEMLRGWLQSSDHFRYIVHELDKSNIPRQFPEPTLDFLDRTLDQTQWIWADELKRCLEAIRANNPDLLNDPRFKKLVTFLRQQGGQLD